MSSNDSFPAGLTALTLVGVALLIGGVGFGIRACSTAEKATFDPVDQEIDRRTFERSQAYREGLRRDFDELMLAYGRAKSDDERAVIVATVRHRAEGAPPEAVPQDVKDFLALHKQ